jgi:hypothetical protein
MQTVETIARATEEREQALPADGSFSAAPANDARAGRPRLGSAFFLALIDGLSSRAVGAGTRRSGGGLG